MHACIQLSFDAYENNNYYYCTLVINFRHSYNYTFYIILYYLEGAEGEFSMRKKSPELCDVYNLLRNHSPDWHVLGIELGITVGDLKSLTKNAALGNLSKLNIILNDWIQGQPTSVTWGKVFEVLIKLNLRHTAQEVNCFLERVDIVKKYMGRPDFVEFKL